MATERSTVYELADELGVVKGDVVGLCRELGIDIASAASTLHPDDADRIRRILGGRAALGASAGADPTAADAPAGVTLGSPPPVPPPAPGSLGGWVAVDGSAPSLPPIGGAVPYRPTGGAAPPVDHLAHRRAAIRPGDVDGEAAVLGAFERDRAAPAGARVHPLVWVAFALAPLPLLYGAASPPVPSALVFRYLIAIACLSPAWTVAEVAEGRIAADRSRWKGEVPALGAKAAATVAGLAGIVTLWIIEAGFAA